MSFTIVKPNITTVCRKTNLLNIRSEAKVPSPLLLSLMDLYVGADLIFSLRFKLYLHNILFPFSQLH